ncbi:aldo/keto reductase [Microbacterium telephonicum]|uniref:D-threo-aldose 1-dehydrogenase n=1 Tax=Microbacterium telephonicum TaxID=1714841 RepID=A0A498C128_9MICO|nr:aldo/keto reductase [Microbacterium telephonicum]RLK46578.1 D-threo-aldose 1-dehydrogenase [Microbacterium telephonicum]
MRTRAVRRGRPLELTELGLGAAQLGNLYRETTDAETVATVEAAWEAGIRYFDTAPHYGVGLSERRLGAQLAARPRDEYVLSTKVGRLLVPSPDTADERDAHGFDVPADPVRAWDFSRDGILRSVEQSLERLGLDRIDILYLHDPDDHFAQASTEGIGALIELRDQGVVAAVGAGMNDAAPLAELIRRADVDVVMCAGRYTLLDDRAAAELLPLALDRGVGVVIAGVYNSGLLSTARPAPNATFDYLPASPEIRARAERAADIAEAHGVTLPDAALAYVRRHPAVVSVVVGARGRDQVEQNAQRARTVVPEALWADLAAAGIIPADTFSKESS